MNKKLTAKWSRWLHIYLSMFSFVIVLFFSVTGLTLNHADYFQKSRVRQLEGRVDSSWVNASDTLRVKKLELVEFFRQQYKVRGALADLRIDDREVSLAFKGPGYESSAFIDRETGAYQFTETNQGLMGFMNDLHKGRDTGTTWLWVIDVSAILMTIVSLTGLILLLFLKKKRMPGLVLLGIGLLLACLVYFCWGQ
jgi:hypothetical protein